MNIPQKHLEVYIKANLIRPWDLTSKLREEHNIEMEKYRIGKLR